MSPSLAICDGTTYAVQLATAQDSLSVPSFLSKLDARWANVFEVSFQSLIPLLLFQTQYLYYITLKQLLEN